jgi:hypothetical protein
MSVLPFGPYRLLREVNAKEAAEIYETSVTLHGEQKVLSGEVIAEILVGDEPTNVFDDDEEGEPCYLVGLSNWRKPRVFAIMTKSEIDVAFQSIEKLTIPKEEKKPKVVRRKRKK